MCTINYAGKCGSNEPFNETWIDFIPTNPWGIKMQQLREPRSVSVCIRCTIENNLYGDIDNWLIEYKPH